MTRTTKAGASTRWLDETEMGAWRGYVETYQELLQALETHLLPHGLTMGDYEVLVFLSESEDARMRMCDLARQLALSPSGLTRRLDGLVKNGLVRREPSSDDRRVMLATLTAEGWDVMRAAAPDHVASVRAVFVDVLSRNELEVMRRAFTKVRAALRAELDAAS